jgi:hypothetical protein
MGDQLFGSVVLVWLAAIVGFVAIACGLDTWFRWRHSMLQRLLE